MKVTAVAQPSAASTKNCQGCRPCSVGAGWLVEVAELIVDAFVERRFDRRFGSLVRLARPLHGDKTNGHRAGRADQVREEPGETAETFVDRCAQHFFATVFRD